MWNTLNVSNQSVGSHFFTADSTDVIATIKGHFKVLPYLQDILQTCNKSNTNILQFTFDTRRINSNPCSTNVVWHTIQKKSAVSTCYHLNIVLFPDFYTCYSGQVIMEHMFCRDKQKPTTVKMTNLLKLPFHLTYLSFFYIQ